ncbi:MAG TPA: cob(I)yrinic acid a,c-diamide adenosyltransferase [Candidatus Dojkabacteria bacterium]|nr:cob(I)yrinic acid a,c-diamide adenosyltransferase [Candidatus Dojkabacteria bacterium]HRO65299.1 cob(I)yrinic acid a,c-diamide adenosyltransferase [Candidatus Dojkabacteria bacterium]HRP51669.1 cob(I)yrinic acid a,c-diamide adenosyltransferase [Candidatus Dojkabacteria bacterium]
MKIYTKTGDKGETSLYGGTRVAKDSAIIDAIGNVDELNASIGLAISKIPSLKKYAEIQKILLEIQYHLFKVGGDLASPFDINQKLKQVRISEVEVEYLEENIDNIEKKLETLRNFILPGGSEIGAILHLSRSICRRAERSVVYANEENKLNPILIIYLNRLSDLLFVLARFTNKKQNIPEKSWII